MAATVIFPFLSVIVLYLYTIGLMSLHALAIRSADGLLLRNTVK